MCFGRHAGERRQRVADELEWRRLGEAEDRRCARPACRPLPRSLKTTRPRFCSGFQTFNAEKATSAEVNGLPSCQVTPSRSLKVTDRPSSDPSQLVARRGSRPSGPSKEASASGSTTLLATKNTPFEATIAGLRLRGSEVGGDDQPSSSSSASAPTASRAARWSRAARPKPERSERLESVIRSISLVLLASALGLRAARIEGRLAEGEEGNVAIQS